MPTHTIIAGDTFWNMSHRYGYILDNILAVNPNVMPMQLQIGQVVQLPDNGMFDA
jgi:LysM repeat protein